MATKFDARQTISRDVLDQIAAHAANKELDDLLRSTDSELTPPLALRASNPASLVVTIGNISVTNPEQSRTRTILPISNTIPAFSSGTITLGSTGAGNATPSVGSAIALGMTASQFMKLGVNIDASGSLTLTKGTPGASLSAATIPATVSGMFAIGYIVVRTDSSNNTASVLNSDVYQYVGGGSGGGSGTGNANAVLETLKNELVDSPYQLLAPNIVISDAATKFSTLTGAAYDLTSNTIKFTANGQLASSIQMADSTEFLSLGQDIGSVDLSAFWNFSSGGTSFNIPKTTVLQNARISTSNTSATVTVTYPNHGLTNGNLVYIQTATAVGGISAANLGSVDPTTLNTIAVVDANTFTYSAQASATSSATGNLDFVVYGYIYQASRDGGNNWFPIPMSRVGTSTNVFRGNLTFDQTATTESSYTTIQTQTTANVNTAINNSTLQGIAQGFTVASTTKLFQATFNLAKGSGTPAGNIVVSIIKDSSITPGTPSTAAADVLSQSNAISISSLGLTTSNADILVKIAPVVLTAGTYHIVLTTDAAYKSGYTSSPNNSIIYGSNNAGTSPYASTYNGTTWTAGTADLTYSLFGRVLDLRVRIYSASGTYPAGLDGYGVFYNLQDVGVVGTTKKTQRFSFNSVTDNLNSFTITAFNPDPDLLNCYWIEGGQVFKAPAFSLSGNTVTFPTSTFNQGGVSQTITLIFDQNTGGAYDNSDSNRRLLASNHLGSTNGADDTSAAGRGILLRDAGGTLRELTLDSNDNISILSSPGGSNLETFKSAIGDSVSSTFTFNGSGGTTASVTMYIQRIGDFVTLYFPSVNGTSGTSSTTLTANTALPTWARPQTNPSIIVVPTMKDNSTTQVAPGRLDISTNGILTFRKDQTGASWTNSTICGPNGNFVAVYYVGLGS